MRLGSRQAVILAAVYWNLPYIDLGVQSVDRIGATCRCGVLIGMVMHGADEAKMTGARCGCTRQEDRRSDEQHAPAPAALPSVRLRLFRIF
jgi:hypothetical protein